MRRRILWAVAAAMSAGMVLPVQVQGSEIAGLHPAKRPEAAPVIVEMKKDAAWYRHALTGVEQPYPASLRFLEDQGAWFTPFIHPGMTGPYDIRGWHVPHQH